MSKQGNDDTFQWGALGESLGFHVRLAENASAQIMASLLGSEKLTAAQLTAIELIGCNPGVQPGRLAKAMALEPSNLASMLRRLEAARLIRTEAGQDRRTRVVSLTSEGQQVRADGERLIAHHQRLSTRLLSRTEKRQLIGLLQKMAAGPE